MQEQETSVFSTTVQTGSGANPAPCSMCTGFFLGVMRPGRDADHSPLSNADVKNGRNYTFLSLYAFIGIAGSNPAAGMNICLL